MGAIIECIPVNIDEDHYIRYVSNRNIDRTTGRIKPRAFGLRVYDKGSSIGHAREDDVSGFHYEQLGCKDNSSSYCKILNNVEYLKFEYNNELLATLKISNIKQAVNKVCPNIKIEFIKKSNIRSEQDTYHIGIYGLKILYPVITENDKKILEKILYAIYLCIEYSDTIGNIKNSNSKPKVIREDMFTRLLKLPGPRYVNTLAEALSLDNKELYMKPVLKTARDFIAKVLELANEYDVSVFVVTEGASGYSNRGCDGVKQARLDHIKWERKHNIDPNHDWANEER
jgi:hypothetical protein